MTPSQLEQFEENLQRANDSLTKRDFESSFKALIDFIKKAKQQLGEQIDAKTQKAVDGLSEVNSLYLETIKKIEVENQSKLSNMKRWAIERIGELFIKSRIQEMIGKMTAKIEEIDAKDWPDADNIAKTASDLAIIEVLKQIPPKDDLKEEISKLGELIVNTISGLLEIKDIKDLREELDELKKMKGRTFGGGGLRPAPTGVEIPVGDIDGINKAYTVTFVPQYITLQGQVMYADNGYTLTSSNGVLTITLDDAPLTNNILRSHY